MRRILHVFGIHTWRRWEGMSDIGGEEVSYCLYCSETKWAEEATFDPQADPLTLAVNRAFNTGEPVYWTKGDPLPDPEGPVAPIEEEGK